MRRLELFTEAGRRRAWSEDEKAAIVVESEGPGVSVSAVARRHGLSVSRLFAWRRSSRQTVTRDRGAALRFVPAVLEPGPPEPARGAAEAQPHRCAGITIAVAGATVRVGPDASEAQIAAVLRALRAWA